MKYAFIPKPRYKKHTSREKRRMLTARLESQWRHWCGQGASKNAEYIAWMKSNTKAVLDLYEGHIA